MKISLIISLLTFLIAQSVFANTLKVYDTSEANFISYETFISKLNSEGFIVLGEYHNQELIQNAQAKVINDKVESENLNDNFSLMWEFLNFTAQDQIDLTFAKYMNDEITSQEFITQTAGKHNMTYHTLLAPLKKYNGEIFGINLDRKYKKQAMDNGLSSLDPNLVPANYHLGSSDYKERFYAVMGSHAPEEVIAKYYMAQCLTDSVMSYHAHKNHSKQLSFIVAGSFHTDFNDATVEYLKELTDLPVSNVKVISGTSEEVAPFFLTDEKYGDYADYILWSEVK